VSAGPLERLLERTPVAILDGAMGTELRRRGVDTGLPLWSARALMTSPATVLQIHREYCAAGADIITANTFRTTARTFRHGRIPDRSLELTGEAVRLARQARDEMPGNAVLVAGSIAPLEDCYRPDLVPDDRTLRVEHAELAYRLASAGADFLLLETMGTIREAFAACEAARRTGLETMVSLFCGPDGLLYGGEPLEDAVTVLEPLGVAAFSLNCTPARSLTPLVARLRALTPLPIGVYGNAGRAGREHEEELVCDVSPDEYGHLAREWAAAGASIVGGCCGTGNEHIRAIAASLRETVR
jgi:S-methylmethionine-dependent homocysteine/selenocysteine methylase